MSDSSTTSTKTSSDLTPWHWGWAAVIAAVTVITLVFRYALPVRDGDLWFHMLYGQYFLEYNTLVADHTIFSWTPATNDTIYCTWLPDIFLYLLHKMAGLPAIFAFRYLCLFVLVLSCYLYARKLKIVAHPLVWFVCLLAVIMSYTAAFEKPEVLSFVFMTLLAWNWWHIRSSGEGGWKNCYFFPLIMLVWVNTHGGFVFGAVFLVLIGGGELLNNWLSPHNSLPPTVRKHLVFALVLASVTPLVNPYGYRYPLQLFFDLIPNQENANFNSKIAAYDAPFAFEDTFSFALCADLAIVLLLFLYWRNFKRIEWSSLLANLFFAFLYTRFFRTTFFWGPIFLFSASYLLSCGAIIPLRWRCGSRMSLIFPVLITAATIGISGDVLYKAAVQPEKNLWLGFGISDGNPVSEAEYIKTYFPHSAIGNTYEQGAYLLWKLWPRNKVFFDARHFPYRKWSDDFFAFSAGKNIRKITDTYRADIWCIGIDKLSLIMAMLETGEWQVAFYGKNSAVLVRMDISLPANAPKVSPDVINPRNFVSVTDCIKFACSIKDWQTAESVLTAMQNTFSLSVHRDPNRWWALFYRGMRAYYEKNYSVASRELEGLQAPPLIVKFALTNCYHFLSRDEWAVTDIQAALLYARKAWDLVPENPYSLYNLGVIIWQQERSSRNISLYSSMQGVGKRLPDWRHFLHEFQRTAPMDQEFNAPRAVAMAMLEGSQQIRPELLTPPEPAAGEGSSL